MWVLYFNNNKINVTKITVLVSRITRKTNIISSEFVNIKLFPSKILPVMREREREIKEEYEKREGRKWNNPAVQRYRHYQRDA